MFADVEFYTPSNYDVENGIIMAYYKEGAETPTFLYFMDGLNAVKCWKLNLDLYFLYIYRNLFIIICIYINLALFSKRGQGYFL